MSKLQCPNCRSNVDVDTGLCASMCKCPHSGGPGCDYVNCTTFTCYLCACTIDVAQWRAKNFENTFKCIVLTPK